MMKMIKAKSARSASLVKLAVFLMIPCLILCTLAFRETGDQERIREVNKWNSYVELNNDMPRLFFQPLEYYFTAFGRAPEYRAATEHHKMASFVSSLPSSKDFEENIKTLAGLDEADNELDEAARDMLPHLKELMALLSQARDYHAAHSYTDDDDAPAAELHARLHAAHAAFLPSHQKFSQLLHKKDAERRKTDMEDMLAHNLRIKPAMLRLVDAAQNIQDYFNAQMITAETILNLEPDNFIVLFNGYISASDTFLKLSTESSELIEEGLKEEGLNEFRINLKEVLTNAEPILAYCQGIKKNSPSQPIKIDNTENLSKSIEKLVDTYNTTIQ